MDFDIVKWLKFIAQVMAIVGGLIVVPDQVPTEKKPEAQQWGGIIAAVSALLLKSPLTDEVKKK